MLSFILNCVLLYLFVGFAIASAMYLDSKLRGKEFMSEFDPDVVIFGMITFVFGWVVICREVFADLIKEIKSRFNKKNES